MTVTRVAAVTSKRPFGFANPLAIAAATTLVALALRLAHVLTTARAIVMGDSIGFEIHARNFLRTWQALGTSDFVPRLLDTIDNSSLQGVVYPAVQSLVYAAGGGVKSDSLLVFQAFSGAATVGITALTAWRVAGPVAGWFAGTILALYGPHVLASGTLTAEAVLITFQTIAIWCIIESLGHPTPRVIQTVAWGLIGGLFLGVTVLRPALQFTALILLGATLAGATLRRLILSARGKPPGVDGPNHTTTSERRHLALAIGSTSVGILLIAAPWWLTNAIAFGQPMWSRTGNSWQQVYWGIYPPNRAWQPQDAPVPPKYGVDSLPEARNAGVQIDVRDLDYLDAAFDQVRATPVQAFATMVEKLAGAWLYPWDPFNEAAPIAARLVPIVHPALLGGMVVGLASIWRRPLIGAILVGTLLATWLPYLAVNIDVRYVVTPAPVNAVVAGIAMADLVAALRAWRVTVVQRLATVPHPLVGAAIAAGIVVATLAAVGPTGILAALPIGLAPATAHLVADGAFAVVVGASMAFTVGVAVAQEAPGAVRLPTHMATAAGIVAGTTLAILIATRTWFAPYWHEWSIDLLPGDRASQSVTLPAGWRTPPGSIVELRLWLQGGRAPRYEPVVRINGNVVANFRPAFDDAGSLRFPESTLAYARLQGKVRADLPQWYAIRVDPAVLESGRLDVDLEASPVNDPAASDPADAWIRIWGDFTPSTPRASWDAVDPTAKETFEGPALFSRRTGADHSVFKYYATGDTLIWRRTPLRGLTSTPVVVRADGRDVGRLDATRLREGSLRMRVVVLDPTYALVAAF
jgi:hypothetical protein